MITMEALKLKRVVVVGHSLGGMGAMTWAARRRPVLAGLVVLDVTPAMNSEGTGPVNAFVSAKPTFADIEEVDDFLAQGLLVSVAGAFRELNFSVSAAQSNFVAGSIPGSST